MDFSEQIKIIFTDPTLLEGVNFFGVQLGHPKSKIPQHLLNGEENRGWLQTNEDIVFRVSGDIVVEILLKKEVLEGLNIRNQENIRSVFGEPDAIEKRYSHVHYFYPTKGVIVTWDHDNRAIFGIYFGENIIEQTVYRASDFLRLYQEFRQMEPNVNNWKLRRLKSNKPRYYRLKQLLSLMKAFHIGDDLLEDFHNRKFLSRRDLDSLAPIMADVQRYALDNEFEKRLYKKEKERLDSMSNFVILIQELLRFSNACRDLLAFNSGWLQTSSITSRYTIYKTNKILNSINLIELEEIESFLCHLIDPKSQEFTEAELQRNYGFPDIDLRAIDSSNW